MMLRTCTLFCASLFTACAFPLLASAQAQNQIAASGTTLLSATLLKEKVTVEIHTVKLEGPCLETYPAGREWMGQGFKQLSVVDDITASVNNHRVPVPPSAYWALFAPHSASLRLNRESFVLRIEGADGAYSYISLLYFDGKEVKLQKVYSGMYPSHPIAITHYYSITIGP
jgi:hypothetical protein